MVDSLDTERLALLDDADAARLREKYTRGRETLAAASIEPAEAGD